MVMVNQPALAICRHMLASNPANTDGRLEKDGKDIYKEKKSLLQGVPGQKKVTWTQKEYAHEGMQLNYLSIKCWQRFTETWALLERAARLGLMAAHQPGARTMAYLYEFYRSVGGRATNSSPALLPALPGWRRLAMVQEEGEECMPADAPREPGPHAGWRPFVEAMDMHFDTYDIEKTISWPRPPACIGVPLRRGWQWQCGGPGLHRAVSWGYHVVTAT